MPLQDLRASAPEEAVLQMCVGNLLLCFQQIPAFGVLPTSWGKAQEAGRMRRVFSKPLGQEDTCIIAKERSGAVQRAVRGLTRAPFACAYSAVVAFMWTACSVL